jgi:hypothetical protein
MNMENKKQWMGKAAHSASEFTSYPSRIRNVPAGLTSTRGGDADKRDGTARRLMPEKQAVKRAYEHKPSPIGFRRR